MSRKHLLSPESYGSRTDVGYVREHNEDNLLTRPPLFVVCDGMGGHEAGEVASEIAVGVIADRAPASADAEALGRALEEANLSILRAVAQGLGREGMGTTCTAAMLEGDRLVIAQAGDSRAYLLHAGVLQQLTRDHSLVADLVDSGEITPTEARTHPWRSYITRALGLDPQMEADLYELTVQAHDRLMLCSDGLYSMIDDAAIAKILAKDIDAQAAANELVAAALEAGGHDNITVIVVDVPSTVDKQHRKIARKTKRAAILVIILLIAILGGSAYALNWWLTTAAYLGEVDGNVAIYQGVPGEVLGIEFSHLDEVSNVKLTDLQPGTASRIQNNEIRCASKAEAQKLIEAYSEERDKRTASSSNNASSASSSAAGTSGSDDASSTGSSSTATSTSSSAASSGAPSSTSQQGQGA